MFFSLIRIDIDNRMLEFKTTKEIESRLHCKVSNEDRETLNTCSLNDQFVKATIQEDKLVIESIHKFVRGQ